MEIPNIRSFLEYYERVRERTHNVLSLIPPAHIEWTYKTGKFTFGDLIRHIATIERYMYAENMQDKQSRYPGCGKELANGHEETIRYFDRLHSESIKIFKKLTPEHLKEKCLTPGGVSITKWKWLRAMVEHEIHHGGQVYIYLSILGVKTNPIYGLTSEEVMERSKH